MVILKRIYVTKQMVQTKFTKDKIKKCAHGVKNIGTFLRRNWYEMEGEKDGRDQTRATLSDNLLVDII